MIRRRWLAAGVLALGLSVSSSASATVVESVLNAWVGAASAADIGNSITGYGASRPGAMTGQTSITLQKAGRLIKWGGVAYFAASLVGDALNWYKGQAESAMHPSLREWWSGGTAGVPPDPMPYTDVRTSGPNRVYMDVCRGYQNGYPLSIWIAKSVYYDEYIVAQTVVRNGKISSEPLSGTSSPAFLLQVAQDICREIAPVQTLGELIQRDPQAATALRDIVRHYVSTHPDAIKPYLTPAPNRNQWRDYPEDCSLDTDGDGYCDCDELRINISPNIGNRPGPYDFQPTDPNEPDGKINITINLYNETVTVNKYDIDGDNIFNWRDGDDDNDGTRDEDEPLQPAECQYFKSCNPDSEKDTDGDGERDRDDKDDDNDKYPDQEEEDVGTDPKNPDSKPADNDKDGISDKNDPDDDNDGIPDEQDKDPKNDKIGKCTTGYTLGTDGNCYKEPSVKCPPRYIRDGAGCIPDPNPCAAGYLRDAAGDCVPDTEKPTCPPSTKLNPATKKCEYEPPEDRPCPDGWTRNDAGKCEVDPTDPTCPDGSTYDQDAQRCTPDEEPPSCPDDQTYNPSTKKCESERETCPPGTEKNADTGKCESEPLVTDECGDLSLARAKAHLGHWLRDAIFPCEPMDDLLEPLYQDLQTRFPFSVAAGLDGWFAPPTDTAGAADLPDALGPIPLEWGWLSGLWSTIKTLVGVALYVWFVQWLIDRFTPRTSI